MRASIAPWRSPTSRDPAARAPWTWSCRCKSGCRCSGESGLCPYSRLTCNGMIPTERSIPRSYALSNERRLYLRLTSPHEAGEDLSEFLATCDSEMWPGRQGAQRWNFAGALQLSMTEKLRESPAEIIESFKERFFPERVRVAILSPDRRGWTMEWSQLQSMTKDLRNSGSCEVMVVDATDRKANGNLYADFFDFS